MHASVGGELGFLYYSLYLRITTEIYIHER